MVSGIDIFAFSTGLYILTRFHSSFTVKVNSDHARDVLIAMWVRVARSFSVVLVLVCPLPIVIPFTPIEEHIQPALAFSNVALSQVMQYIAPAPVAAYIVPVPAVSFVVSALAIEYIALAPAVSFEAPAVPYPASVVS